MKKALSLILALTLVFAMAIPVLAGREENPTGGNSTITYAVASSYSITIPTGGVTITGTSATATVGVNASALIDANKHLEFSISDATHYDNAVENNVGFRLVNGSLATVFLHYTISCTGIDDIVKDTVFLSASAAEANLGKTVELTFTPDAATQAGTYTDMITFNVAAVDNTPAQQ